jgi:hypothetical protein
MDSPAPLTPRPRPAIRVRRAPRPELGQASPGAWRDLPGLVAIVQAGFVNPPLATLVILTLGVSIQDAVLSRQPAPAGRGPDTLTADELRRPAEVEAFEQRPTR